MNNKKAMSQYFLVTMLASLLGFFVMFSFFTSTSNNVMSEVDEQKCKTYIQAKSSQIGKIADFFLGLSNSCSSGTLEVKTEEKEEVFRELADRSYSCWKRYGEGEEDFMSNFDTTGKYCFPCTQIIFDEDLNFDYDYIEFIEWTQENSPRGVDENYANLINFEYLDPNTEKFHELETSLQELDEDIESFQEDSKDSTLVELYLYLGNYRTQLFDMKNKKISSNEPQYVVFRYERLENSQAEIIKNTATGALASTGGSLAAGTALKFVLTGPVGVVSTAVNVVGTIKKAAKIERISEKFLDTIKAFKNMKRSTKAVGAGIIASGVAGADLGSDYNSNYNQYIDVLDEEQYYRICGVKPPMNN